MKSRPVSGSQTLSITSGAALSLTVPDGCNYGVLQVIGTSAGATAPIRVYLDGTAPTSTAGKRLDVGDVVVLESLAELVKFKAIAESTTCTAAIDYYDRD